MSNKFHSLKTLKAFILIVAIILIPRYTYSGSTPPVTTYTQDPNSPNGNNGWYVTPITLTLEATDLESGVKEINYRLNGGTWTKKTFDNTLNLAPNPSFEISGGDPPLSTLMWKISNPSDTATFSRSTAQYAPGFSTTSIGIASTDPGWHGFNHRDDYASASPYANMSASIKLKTQGVAGSAYFKVYAVSDNGMGGIISTEIAQSTAVSGTVDWTQVYSNFNVNVADAIGVYMEIGLSGTGTVWADAASLTNSTTTATTQYIIGADGEHTFEFYSVDRAGNTEAVNTITRKIDQTPPGNWHDSGAIRSIAGAEHEVYVYVTVEDATSGISLNTDRFQYNTPREPGFGYYEGLIGCNTTWNLDQWESLISPEFSAGDQSVYLLTPRTDFCDSNWKVCKSTRFYAEDMAGNTSTKDFCINGPWIKIRGEGIVRSNSYIDMIAEPEGENTDGLIEVSGITVNFFTSSKNWKISNNLSPTIYSYSALWDLAGTKTQITNNTLRTTSGVYYIDGDFSVSNSNTPSSFRTANFNQIIFVDGDLSFSNDIYVASDSTALFVVSGNVNISKNVSIFGVAVLTDRDLYTAHDIKEGQTSGTLTMSGIYQANKIYFQRTLQGANNNDSPSEDITYEPKYLVNLREIFKTSTVKWLPEN